MAETNTGVIFWPEPLERKSSVWSEVMLRMLMMVQRGSVLRYPNPPKHNAPFWYPPSHSVSCSLLWRRPACGSGGTDGVLLQATVTVAAVLAVRWQRQSAATVLVTALLAKTVTVAVG